MSKLEIQLDYWGCDDRTSRVPAKVIETHLRPFFSDFKMLPPRVVSDCNMTTVVINDFSAPDLKAVYDLLSDFLKNMRADGVSAQVWFSFDEGESQHYVCTPFMVLYRDGVLKASDINDIVSGWDYRAVYEDEPRSLREVLGMTEEEFKNWRATGLLPD